MPNVGLLTAAEPLEPDHQVVIRFSVEVDRLPVYNESYDVDTLAAELKTNRAEVLERWAWRILGVVACRSKPGFSACVTRSLTDGQACSYGHEDCEKVSGTQG